MNKVSVEDEIFCAQFESCEYPPEKFKHREHLKLAYIYLTKHGSDTACKRMRESLKNYLEHNNVDSNKYHETITRAWILAVHHFMQKVTVSDSSDSFIDQYPIMLNSRIMMTHYSAELLFSVQAREKFVEPDLDPIPRHES